MSCELLIYFYYYCFILFVRDGLSFISAAFFHISSKTLAILLNLSSMPISARYLLSLSFYFSAK